MGFPPAATYQKALFAAGIPLTAFNVEDVEAEYKRLKEAGVSFSLAPTLMGTVKLVVFDDTCGNNIQLFQVM